MIDLRSHTPKGQRARARILAAAEAHFTTHGFHGTSVRDLAKAAGLPLATVVYHFARKEQLYADVLAAIADELVQRLDGVDGPDGLADALLGWTQASPGRVVLLLRELLDNPARLARAARFPLAPFLERASALVAGAPGAGAAPELAVLHLVGALSYVVAARPTVDRIVGRERARTLAAHYPDAALAFAHRVLGLDLPEATHAATAPAPARPARARAPRTRDDRSRRRPDAARRRRLRRPGAVRPRARAPVPRPAAADRPRLAAPRAR